MAEPPAPVWASVWATAQRPAAAQRRGRYLEASTHHPAKMLPAIAAEAVARFSAPGELVFDPMCGVGTTLVEAVNQGRHGLGVECEPQWAALSRANVRHARTRGATGTGQVVDGDARALPHLIDPRTRGRVALVVTSPPYGRSVHGQVRARPGEGVAKWAHRYGHNGSNLAYRRLADLLAGLVEIFAGCRALLRPTGTLVVTVRPWRHHGELIDFPALVADAAADAGLVLTERLVALLAGLRGDQLVPRASFFQLQQVRTARERGIPLHVIAHEDLLVFRPVLSADGHASTAHIAAGENGPPVGRAATGRMEGSQAA